MNGATIKSIRVRELHELSRTQPVDLIDVRTPEEFAEAHAVIARNVPIATLNPHEVMQGRMCRGDEPVYMICQGGGRSSKACVMMLAAGHPNVVNVEGGTGAWIDAGLPTQRSRQPISIERQIKIVHGSLILLGLALGWYVSPWWYALTALVGGGQIATGLTDICGTRMLLAKMPWNRRAASSCSRR
jgi:rhodanese-related sulfurtransferase